MAVTYKKLYSAGQEYEKERFAENSRAYKIHNVKTWQ